MYEEFFEMTHTPFVRGIPVDNLYEDQDTEEVYNRLLYAASRQLFALVVGDAVPNTLDEARLRFAWYPADLCKAQKSTGQRQTGAI